MSWEVKRKIIYALAFVTGCIAITVFLLRGIIFPDPTCYDSKQNGFESGIDCGGRCSLQCTQDVSPLVVIWSKAVPAGNGIYDFVGLVQNKNLDNASHALGYTFIAYDDFGEEMFIKSGTTTPPLDGTFPIIVQNIPLSTSPRKVVMTLTDTPHYKVLENPNSSTVKVLERRYDEQAGISRVYARIFNTKQMEIRNLPVRVVLLDQNDNAYAVGETFIPVLGKEDTQDAVVTWNEVLPTPPTRILVYPIFNPFDAIK